MGNVTEEPYGDSLFGRVGALNSVLRLKQWHKEALESEIVRVQEIINTHEESLRRLETDLLDHIGEFRKNHEQEALSPERIQSFHAYMDGMKGRMKREQDSVRKRVEELRGKEEKLISIYREKMVVEKLKERHLKEVRRMSERKEQKEMDFISLRRYQK